MLSARCFRGDESCHREEKVREYSQSIAMAVFGHRDSGGREMKDEYGRKWK